MAERLFSDKEIETLIKKKRLRDLDGFKSKNGNTFSAGVILSDDGLSFEYED